MIVDSILWRRLDVPGHDACRLERTDAGWLLDGAAVFCEEGVVARLAYRIVCDSEWRSRQGRVEGWLGERAIDLRVARSADGVWSLNGVAVSRLDATPDLDLGFTPASNLLQLRRAGLKEGQGADLPAAWLDVAQATLSILPQRYERRSATTYWYEAPSFGYRGLLEVRPSGFVVRYPELWEVEDASESSDR